MNLHLKNRIFGKYLPYIILVIIGVLFLLPLIWVVLASFDPNASSALKLPARPSLANYVNVVSKSSNRHAFAIGLIISCLQTIFVVVFSGLAAYPLSRYQMKNKRLFMYTILFMTSLPITAVMIPVYEEFVAINLYDNIFGVILFMSASSLPYAIWMMKNFMDSVSIELDEAARVDGATTFQSITRIVMPLMVPGIFTVAVFTFSGSWGNFFVPFILISSNDNMPAAVQLYQFFGQHGLISYGPLAAYSILYAIPSIVLYAISQNYMSQGFSMQGATKG